MSRRAINAARTRIAILEAAQQMANERHLVDIHVEEIAENWDLAMSDKELKKIDPLD